MTTETTLNQLIRPKRLHKKYMPSAQSLANLKPYKPGTNGHGRVYPLKERLQHALDHPLVKPKEDAPAGELLVYATLKGAIDLMPAPFHEAWDRVEGKLHDSPTVNFNEIKILVVREEPKMIEGEG